MLAVIIIGFAVLGPGTLLDLSLALFIGTTVGAFSSVFIATPLLVDLRRKDPEVVKLAADADKHQAREQRRSPVLATSVPADSSESASSPSGTSATTPASGDRQDAEPVDTDGPQTVTGRKVHKYAQSGGPRNQPKKTPGNRRGTS